MVASLHLSSGDKLQRRSYLQVLSASEAKEALVMNNGYFFGLLDRMISGNMLIGKRSDAIKKAWLMAL